MRNRRVLAVVALLLVAVALPADAKKKKKSPPPEEEAPPAAETTTPPPVVESKPATPPPAEPAAPPPARPAETVASEPLPERAWRNPVEPSGVRQYYLGIRYRGTVIPQFMQNLFVNGGRTVYSNSVGLEIDLRRDKFSVIPNVTFTEYSLPDTLFNEKGKDPSNAANWSYVNSGLMAVYIGVDVLWSVKLHRMLDLELGFGLGIGVVFGNLIDNWVYANNGGPLTSPMGQRYSPCVTEGDGFGCSRANHSASTPKVGSYVEKNWFNGGAVPTFFARLTLPIIGVRIKPIRDAEFRIGFGWSITEGFFFGISGNYRLPTRQ